MFFRAVYENHGTIHEVESTIHETALGFVGNSYYIVLNTNYMEGILHKKV